MQPNKKGYEWTSKCIQREHKQLNEIKEVNTWYEKEIKEKYWKIKTLETKSLINQKIVQSFTNKIDKVENRISGLEDKVDELKTLR